MKDASRSESEENARTDDEGGDSESETTTDSKEEEGSCAQHESDNVSSDANNDEEEETSYYSNDEDSQKSWSNLKRKRESEGTLGGGVEGENVETNKQLVRMESSSPQPTLRPRAQASRVLILPLGGACQAWLDNLLSKYGVVAADLDTKISRDDIKAAWHKQFQVEPVEIKAMDKLMVFEQGTLPSVDWIAEYERLTPVSNIQMGFKVIKHYFISRSCPALGNALTHVENTLTIPTEFFDKVTQIIVTNEKAKNLHRLFAIGPSRD
ncbi:hypothetical protein CBR_g39492 [Chara braunii]|uniref:Uncharacterized protein n=1 Tax=Chara braunii TaxID=69332 RepID=A0A388LRR0_CHABU|nr:hypothetical protein CBR_g39492 [Chara braunii]|eukprot:GBG85028.1 hypothetical protein CBR_g39492 [Chara braunii]